MNGITVIERAYIAARIDAGRRGIIKDSQPAIIARNALSNEYNYLASKMRGSKGCMFEWTKVCENLLARFERFPGYMNKNALSNFVNNSYTSKPSCLAGYPVSSPTGKRLCRKCDTGKEPKFLRNQEARCGYLVEKRAPKGSKRLWAHDLKIKDSKLSGEAGIYTQRLTYPDKCNAKNKGCGQAAANRLCKTNKLGTAVAYKVWKLRPNSRFHRERFVTVYENGKQCKANKDGFSKSSCRTFQYIDCSVRKAPKKAKSKSMKEKRK